MDRTGFAVLRFWFRRGAWAPLTVLLIHAFVTRSSYRISLDWLMHFLGGAAMAFFLYQGVLVCDHYLGKLRPTVRHLLAFGLTCAVVIAWELAELAVGRMMAAGFQMSLTETLKDQFFGVVGAIFSLFCIAVLGHWTRASSSAPPRRAQGTRR